MPRQISKDTRLCISLAGGPSNTSTCFHNFLYEELGLDFVSKACTTADLAAAIVGIRGLGIRGCGVSMPYTEACIPYLDELDASARALQAANTIVNDDAYLRGHNTDYIAAPSCWRSAGCLLTCRLRCAAAAAAGPVTMDVA